MNLQEFHAHVYFDEATVQQAVNDIVACIPNDMVACIPNDMAACIPNDMVACDLTRATRVHL